MTMNINFRKECKWSLKTIYGKIRTKFPISFYKSIILVRYIFFRKNCLNNTIVYYSDGSWVDRGATEDLRNIQVYLSRSNKLIKVMQAGIGNSSLFSVVRDRVTKLVGVTIVPEEEDYAKTQFPNEFGTKYEVHIANKYSDDLFLGDGFDVIVDNDISSYACCKHHFFKMLDNYRRMIAKNGVVLVGINGLGYFDNGLGLTEYLAKKIFFQHGFVLHKMKECYELRLIEGKYSGV